MSSPGDKKERLRRWRLALGDPSGSDTAGLSPDDVRMDKALAALYGQQNKPRAGLGSSSPRVARWLGDIREFFPTPVVQVIQKDAFERLGLQRMLLEPEFLQAMEADVHLVADLISLNAAMPEKTKETAREVVGKVVEELMKRLEQKTAEAVRGALNRSKRTRRPRFNDVDWARTIRANLRHYQPDYKTVVPETLIGFARRARTLVDLEEVVLCVDQSGSMATSVVYSSIFAAVMASLPGVDTKLVCFDTSILDLTEMLEDPVDVLFGTQLGGGTDINQAIAYCEDLIRQPTQTHMILISDLCEGGDVEQLLARASALVDSGVNLITLLALSDEGHAWHDEKMAAAFAALGSPVFACTPDQFPDLMAAALQRQDIAAWAAEQDIALVRGG